MNRKRSRKPPTARLGRIQLLETRRLLAAGPYAPAAGVAGTTAIDRLSPAIVGWATAVNDYSPGASVDAAFQVASEAIGPAEGAFDRIVSLGEGGSISLQFAAPIRDGLGADFAVFENSFSDTFLELAFVEVSSDGVNFVRFASDSLTPSAIGPFGDLDPTNLSGLAGKYRGGFGVPFDLESLSGTPGLDVTAITHVRIVDIVGDGSATDSTGDPIYDPTPTTGSAGFDLDGIGVIHERVTGVNVIGWETAGATLPVGGFDNGQNAGGEFREEELRLNNDFDSTFQSWRGWSLSSVTDNTTVGFANQYSSFAGVGSNGSSTYAVGFVDASATDLSVLPTITIDPASLASFDSLSVSNTTYAATSMRDGDAFAKKFGGVSGNDPDFLTLHIDGLDSGGVSVGRVSVELADFRFADNSLDFILDTWQPVDVTSLVGARSLRMSMESSDVGAFGINTPTYVAIDDVVLRQPAVAFDLAASQTLESQPVTARVSRSSDDVSQPIVVSLNAAGDSMIVVPSTVTIPAGQRFVDLTLTPINDSVAGATKTLTLTASTNGPAAGLLPSTRVLTILDDESLVMTFSESAITVVEDSGATTLTLSRNDADLTGVLAVSLAVTGSSLVSVPGTITIPAGQRSVNVPLTISGDARFGSGETSTLTASSVGRDSVQATIVIEEDDLPTLTATQVGGPLDESELAQTILVTVTRNTLDRSQPLEVNVSVPEGAPISSPVSVTIPAGSDQTTFMITVINDNQVNASASYLVRLGQTNFVTADLAIVVLDDDSPVSLTVTGPVGGLNESTAPPVGDFELLGRGVGRGESQNNAGPAGRFVTGGIRLENQFDDSMGFENWSGFAISRGDDTQTAGFLNQYSAITGIGAGGSDTYAIAYAASPVTLSRPIGSQPFASIAVTNTTYAAISMRDGDAFAKKFGGESGNDADLFLLTIDGLDADGNSIGQVEFALADFRFDDNTLDAIVDQWTTIDLSTIDEAMTLSFSLTSTDVGAFGMNTPAYFAVDDIRLAADESSLPAATIVRTGGDVSQPLDVTLESDLVNVMVPSMVTFAAGQTEVAVPLRIVNDSLASGRSNVTLSATTVSGAIGGASMTWQDADTPAITLTPSTGTVNESSDEAVTLLVHRNTADVSSDLVVSLQSEVPERLAIAGSVMIPAGSDSIRVPLDVQDDQRASGDVDVELTAGAAGFGPSHVVIQVQDDDLAHIVVSGLVAGQPLPLLEGSTNAFTLVLSSRPDSVVTLALNSAARGLLIEPASLTFDAETWNVPQTVVLTKPFDFLVEPNLNTQVLVAVVPSLSDDLFDESPAVEVPIEVLDRLPSQLVLTDEFGQTVIFDSAGNRIIESVGGGADVTATTGASDDEVRLIGVSPSTRFVVIATGDGDDVVRVSSNGFTTIDGGAGIDQLVFELPAGPPIGSTTNVFDLATVIRHRIAGFETIYLDNDTSFINRLDADALATFSGDRPLTIHVPGSNAMDLIGGWEFSTPTVEGGEFSHRLVSGQAVLQIQTPLPHQNPRSPYDVNGDGIVNARDALVVINRLNSPLDSQLTMPPLDATWAGPFYDVSGDSVVSARDALQVINHLNAVDRALVGEAAPASPQTSDEETRTAESLVDEALGMLF